MKKIILCLLLFAVSCVLYLYGESKAEEVDYLARSYNSAALADLRNAATAQEAYYVDHMSYTDSLEDLYCAT